MNDTVEYTLRDGKKILIDADNIPLVEKYPWRASKRDYITCPYVKGYKDGKRVVSSLYLHKLVLPTQEGYHTDHINGNKLDNRRANLRPATHNQNMCNLPPRNGRKYKGLTLSRGGKFVARVNLHGKKYYIGTFDTEQEAALAYNNKAKELQGEFAWLNKI